jgi:hypothetical protein
MSLREILEEQLKYTCPHTPPREVKDCPNCKGRTDQALLAIQEELMRVMSEFDPTHDKPVAGLTVKQYCQIVQFIAKMCEDTRTQRKGK